MSPSAKTERLKPAALHPGDTVGIIAPASGFNRDDFEKGCCRLREMGYEPSYLPSIFDRDLYMAGAIERRVDEFHEIFRRPEIKAILCARGGYGANYLLPYVDLSLVRRNPKIFLGCSDVTSLLIYLLDAAGMVAFHGPMLAGDFARADGLDLESWQAAVASETPYEHRFGRHEVQLLAPGTAEGILYGGCLTLLCASLGTPYEIHTKGTILFLEDRGEAPYRIDRMLRQLKLAGKFQEVRGIIFGEMLDCDPPPGQHYTLQDVVMRVLGDLHVPIAYGLRSGHVRRASFTLPLGVRAVLTAEDEVGLRYESGVAVPHATAPAPPEGRR